MNNSFNKPFSTEKIAIIALKKIDKEITRLKGEITTLQMDSEVKQQKIDKIKKIVGGPPKELIRPQRNGIFH